MSFLIASVKKDLARWRQDRTALLIWLGIPFLMGGLITSMIDGGGGTPTGVLLLADEDGSLSSGLVAGAYSQEQLGARDALHLTGEFPAGATKAAIESLSTTVADLEILSHDDVSLMLTLSSASQHLPAIFQAVSGAGGYVSETNLRSPNLETLFLLLTGKELRE